MPERKNKFEVVVIGGSAGSLSFVLKLVPLLRPEMNIAVILVFHRKSSEETTLVDLLTQRTSFLVKEAEEKESIRAGVIYIAPADYHVLIEKDCTLSLDDSEKVNFSRPSIDVTFDSASDVYREALACVLLSGANADGVEGLKLAKDRGSLLLVQDPATAEVPFMPQQAIDNVAIDTILTLQNLDEFMARFLK